MRQKGPFIVNGNNLLLPDADVSVSFTDLDSDASGRDEMGYMHRDVLRSKVTTWSFIYSRITDEELKYMEGIFRNLSEFNFDRPDPQNPGSRIATKCYRSNFGIAWRNAKTGEWRNYKFNIIEC